MERHGSLMQGVETKLSVTYAAKCGHGSRQHEAIMGRGDVLKCKNVHKIEQERRVRGCTNKQEF